MLIKGADLNDQQKRQVLSAYIYRWTSGNPQREAVWAKIEGKPTMPLQTDDEFLAEHAFHFVANGSRLKVHPNHCEPVFMAEVD